MAVSTRAGSLEDDQAMEEHRPAGRWGGRLLLFVLTSPGRTMQVCGHPRQGVQGGAPLPACRTAPQNGSIPIVGGLWCAGQPCEPGPGQAGGRGDAVRG